MTGILIKSSYFAGGSRVFGAGPLGLTAVIRSMAQAQAKIAASAVSALTDSSGAAAANGTVEAFVAFSPAVLGAADCVQKAALETGILSYTDALKELVAQANALHAKVPALDGVLVDNMSGTAVNGTIEAVTLSYTGVGTSLASATGANAVIVKMKNAVATLTRHVNKLAVACGVTPVIDLSGGTPLYTLSALTFADIPSTTGTAVSGADVTSANAAIKATDAATKVIVVGNAIKELATVLNACRSATGGTVGVVAI